MVREAGLEIVEARQIPRLSDDQIEAVYGWCRANSYFQGLCDFLKSGPVVAYLVRGDQAIDRLNQLVGATDPAIALPNSIRGRFGESIRRNISHSTLNRESCLREAQALFGPTAAEVILANA
jgi:nucleoside-diphosphate kinase